MKLISVFLTEEQIKNLKKLAAKTGLKIAEHIRRAVDEYLKKFFIVIILLLLSSPAIASESSKWTWENTALQTIYSGLWIADWCQTLHAARNPKKYRETNKALDIHPSTNQVNRHFARWIVIHPLISLALPKEITILKIKMHPRTLWQSIYIGYEYNVVQQNRLEIGLSFHF